MSFLNFALLPALLALAGVPLLIHLMNLKFPTYFPFPSVKHLRDTVAQRSRLFRWRHLVLLAMRTLFVLALLFAFLRPVLPRFGSNADAKSGRTVLLLLDRSPSMEHVAGGVSARQRAVGEAEKILGTLGPDDTVNIVLAAQTPAACFSEASKNHAEARRFIDALKPGIGRADFSLANAAAARLLAKATPRTEIYYLSDFQRKTWAAVDFTLLPSKARIFFVDAAPQPRGNHALLSAVINQAQALSGDTVTVEIEVGNFAAPPLDVPVNVVIDRRASCEKSVNVPPWSSAKLTLPVPPGGPGLHLCEVTMPPDELPQDDRFCLAIPVLEKEGILIVSDAPEPDKGTALFLRTALNPYENLAGSLLPEQVRAADLTPAKLSAVKKIFLTRTGRLDDDAIHRIADFIFHGGGVVWFLDGAEDAQNLAALERASPLPIKLGGRRVAKNVGADAQQIIRGDFKSKFLRLFAGARRQNLALLEFYDLHDASATGAGQVLLIGCELETLDVDLLRNGVAVQKRRIEAGEAAEVPVEFEVTEPETGQYEYEVRVRPLEGETDRENNVTLTFLNVIDQQVQVLVLEGSPYWDSTFLQRSLMRNERMNVDVVIAYADDKTRVVRKKTEKSEFQMPKLPQEWRCYDVVVLGRDVDRIVGPDGLKQLDDYAKNQGGTVVFSHGPAFGKMQAQSEIEPVIWGESTAARVRMTPAREGQALAPFRALAEQQRGEETLPELIAVHPVKNQKTLAATLATAQAGGAGDVVPAIVHRRFGEGQVLSVGVEGLWRWAFNSHVDGPGTFFDRF